VPSEIRAAQALARRLRSLRREGIDGEQITQPMLAAALGVSVPLISAWENAANPKVPPAVRIASLATFYASTRTLATDPPQLVSAKRLNAAERRRMEEIHEELVALRDAALREADEAQQAARAHVPSQYQPPRDLVDPATDKAYQRQLLDPRSLIQHMLDTVGDHLRNPSDETRVNCDRVVRTMRSAPWLVGSTVITDNELADIEALDGWANVYIVSSHEEIEFVYPAVGPSFASAIHANLEAGVRYRYLVPDLPATVDRARSLMAEFPGLEIRHLPADYWRTFTETIEELVVYEPDRDRSDLRCRAYYQYPGSSPLKWITVDEGSAQARLHDVRRLWENAKEPTRR